MGVDELVEVVSDALADVKGQEVRVLDVRGQTSITDYMIIASGTSERHLKSLAERVVERARELGVKPSGMEGGSGDGWILVDLLDVVVHLMRPSIRDFYGLERLWGPDQVQDPGLRGG